MNVKEFINEIKINEIVKSIKVPSQRLASLNYNINKKFSKGNCYFLPHFVVQFNE